MSWVGILIMAVLMVAAYILMPKPTMESAKRAGLNDFSFPTNSNARAVPEAFGTVKLFPNILWAGDLRSYGISSKGQNVGYGYYMGVAGALCSKIDNIVSFGFSGDIIYTASHNFASGGNFSTRTGKKAASYGSGDTSGSVTVYFGDQSEPSAYLSAQTNSQIAYKNVAYFVLNGFVGDNVTSIPDYFFVVKRTNLISSWAYSDINGDANPAHILYYMLTSLLKYPAAQIDANTFQACGHQLFQEGLGLSLTMANESEAKEWVEEILRTIDGVLNINLATGKLYLKLLRDDYDLASCPVINDSIARKVSFSRKSWENTLSSIVVKYTSRDTFDEASISGINTAAKKRLGYEKSETLEFMGVTNAANANLLLNRSFKKLSYPLAAVTFEASIQDIGTLNKGDVISFSNSAYGIQNLAIRIISLGAIKEDDQSVAIEGIEDIFALGNFVITGNQSNEGIPNDFTVGELEYYDVVNPTPEFSQTRCVIPLCAAPTSGFTQNIEVKSDIQAISITPYALGELAADYPQDAGESLTGEFDDDVVGFTISPLAGTIPTVSASNAQWQAMRYVAWIDDELIAFKRCVRAVNGTFHVSYIQRGAMGTSRSAHNAGAKVWFAPAGVDGMALLPIAEHTQNITFTPRNMKEEGQSVSVAHEYNFAIETPYLPFALRATRSGSNITITFSPCARFGGFDTRPMGSYLAGDGDNEMEGDFLISWDSGSAVKSAADLINGVITFTRTDAVSREYTIVNRLGIFTSPPRKITI